MKQTLEELWRGDIRPFAQVCNENIKSQKLFEKSDELRDALYQTLTEEQKEMFRAYENLSDEITAISESNIFIHGFRLGAKIMTEVFDDPCGVVGD